jgi:predicted DNA-binding protein (UPF0251 family)
MQIDHTKTKSQMADEMGICLRTLQRRLKKAGLKIPRGLIFEPTQQIIYRKLTLHDQTNKQKGNIH